MKVLIYGCGNNGKFALKQLESKYGYEVLAFIDRYVEGKYEGKDIIGIENIDSYNYDKIIISLGDYEIVNEIQNDLVSEGIDKDKIIRMLYDPCFIELFGDARSEYIKDCASWMNENDIEGSAAECGVYRGDSAKFINKYFCERKLYLFDTFQGFDKTDLGNEIELIGEGFDSGFFTKELFNNTCLEIVFSKLTNPENVIIKQGYFPESAQDVDDRFCFVNLDMDLHDPMLEGLRFFYSKMVDNGVILMHDYFHKGLQGVKAAIEDFEKSEGVKLKKMPIGDHCSLAIIK